MKTLKFRQHLVAQVFDGSKTVTWRLFDDKNLSVGDALELINWDTKEKFAEAEITSVREKKLGDIVAADFAGHEKYETPEDMLRHYKEYYGEKVTMETIVKMITFKLK